MSPTRRDFLSTTSLVGAGLAFGCSSADAVPSEEGLSQPSNASSSAGVPKKILMLGGTGFIGPNMVRYAVERGHEVTIFTRGRSQADIPDVEQLTGDRNDDLSALEGRQWDVVLDNNSRDYRWVQLSTEVLKDSKAHYIFVSSISAYDIPSMGFDTGGAVLLAPLIDEDSNLFGPEEDWSDGDEAPYGLTKSLGEGIVHAAFPGKATIVRPGLIVGPGDPTDRWTYWPVRIAEGGEVLAPGNPDHSNQVIDQRDLTEWIVRLAEEGTMGDFNGTGPASRMSMAEMLYGIRATTDVPVKFTWVSEDFLDSNAVRPWSDLPSWIPGDALMYVNVERAVSAGLTYRPLAVTAQDTIDWNATRPAEERDNPRAGLSREREKEVLALWAAEEGNRTAAEG